MFKAKHINPATSIRLSFRQSHMSKYGSNRAIAVVCSGYADCIIFQLERINFYNGFRKFFVEAAVVWPFRDKPESTMKM